MGCATRSRRSLDWSTRSRSTSGAPAESVPISGHGIMAAMSHGFSAGLLAVVLATQGMQTACPKDSPTTPQTGEVFTTRDGVRFSVETILTGLEVPWSLNFAPDGRLFVTERPGRVRIVTLGGVSELALTLDGSSVQCDVGRVGGAGVMPRCRLRAGRSRSSRSRARSGVCPESLRLSLLLRVGA